MQRCILVSSKGVKMMKKYLKVSFFTTVAAILAVSALILPYYIVYATEDVAESSTTSSSTASDGRPLYTEETRPDFPVFNSLVGEENFLSIASPDGTVAVGNVDSLELFPGREYKVAIKYDNNGLPRGITTRAIANDTVVQVNLPEAITSERELTATISASNTQPLSISCDLTLVAAEPLRLEVIPNTVRIVNQNQTNDSLISAQDLFGNGALIGSNSMTGIVLYGPENAGSVVFTFRAVSFDQKSATSKANSSSKNTLLADLGTDEWMLLCVLGVFISFVVILIIIAVYFVCTSDPDRE